MDIANLSNWTQEVLITKKKPKGNAGVQLLLKEYRKIFQITKHRRRHEHSY